jgi:hypothetical protein
MLCEKDEEDYIEEVAFITKARSQNNMKKSNK